MSSNTKRLTAKDICASVSSRLLDTTVSDIHLADVVPHFHEWEEFAPYLDLTQTDEEDIKTKYSNRPRLMRREALRIWKHKNGSKATYRKLIVVFCSQGRADVAEKVRNLAQAGDKTQSELLDTIYSYLRDCYIDLPQALSSSQQWPVLPRFCYVDLELFDVPITHSADQLKPITLESMLVAGNFKAKKKVILVEGISGSGKTTLSRYACNQWATGKIFKNIRLLIHVSVSDPDIQSAQNLSDLIPHPAKEIRDAVADMIGKMNGKHICFILDACDEAPQQFMSFLERFIAGSGRLGLSHITIVLFSRPGLPLKYDQYLTGKIMVKGFTLESLYKYIKLRFDGDSRESQLLSAFEMKPELESLCSLPLNAAILVFLYDHFKDNLPNTRTELFYPLLCNHLLRHVRTREKKPLPRLKHLPDDLPSEVALSFKKVSKIAYSALVEGMMIVDVAFLESHDFPATENNMLGLLQVSHQKITMYGDEQYYSFVHLSLQEFLAAFYMCGLDENGQLKAFETIFHQNPLSPVLTFYSGLTNLSLRKVQDVLLEVLLRPIDQTSVMKSVLTHRTPSADPRRQLLALANCCYECKNEDIFERIKLPEDTKAALCSKQGLGEIEKLPKSFDHLQPSKLFTLPFSHMTLLPSDMLSIGRFTRLYCDKYANSQLYGLLLDLSYCSIGDPELKALAIDLSKKIYRSLTTVTLSLHGVSQNNSTAMSIKKLIEGRTYLAGLGVSMVPWSQPSESEFFLKRIIEGLSNNSTCDSLILSDFSLNASHIHSLTLLLVSATNVTALYLTNNDFSQGMPLFSRALRYSSITILELSRCNIDDPALLSLRENLCEPLNSVSFLGIEDNPFTSAGLTEFLKPLAKSRLQTLGVHLPLNQQQEKIITMINKSHLAQGSTKTLVVKHILEQNKYVVESATATIHMISAPQLSRRSHHHFT